MTNTNLTRITDHIYWMPPGPPDRPSLCAVVGSQFTLMLEAGASAAHARLFLDSLSHLKIPTPHYVALTHWHWDHIFGAAELAMPVIAHELTARQLAVLATYNWSDAALDQRVTTGEEIAFCADNIKLELPEPRRIHIIPPALVFSGSLELKLGGVSCAIHHVGGDHAADSCVMYIEQDKLLFLGDCLYDAIYTPQRHYTTRKLFPLLDQILAFDALHYIEGHTDTILTRPELETMAAKMRLAGTLVDQFGTDEAAILRAVETQTGQPPDSDTQEFVNAFVAGLQLT